MAPSSHLFPHHHLVPAQRLQGSSRSVAPSLQVRRGQVHLLPLLPEPGLEPGSSQDSSQSSFRFEPGFLHLLLLLLLLLLHDGRGLLRLTVGLIPLLLLVLQILELFPRHPRDQTEEVAVCLPGRDRLLELGCRFLQELVHLRAPAPEVLDFRCIRCAHDGPEATVRYHWVTSNAMGQQRRTDQTYRPHLERGRTRRNLKKKETKRHRGSHHSLLLHSEFS
jgi:hypothetical protein